MPGNVIIAGVTISPAESAPPVEEWHSLLAVVRSLMPGIEALPDEPLAHSNVAHTYLCAHATECVLKAFISYKCGSGGRLKDRDIRHSLVKLWEAAVDCGLTRPRPAPEWLDQLDFLHEHPYHLRYQQNILGFAVPHTQPARSELQRLLADVQAALPPDPYRV